MRCVQEDEQVQVKQGAHRGRSEYVFFSEVAKIRYLLISRSFFLASRSTGISSWPLLHNTGQFVAAIEIFENFRINREVSVHITITFLSCLIVFGVFAFLLASAQFMYTSHGLRFILDDQTQVDSKQAGQPEHASINQCQLIVAYRPKLVLWAPPTGGGDKVSL